MSQPLSFYAPNIEHLITEDDTPVDNMFSEKQMRLLTEPLYSSWAGPGDDRTFLACANVGVFYIAKNPAIVPDVLLSVDVEASQDILAREHRSYFLWEFGKPPDVVIEIVSNTIGEEDTEKMKKYARMKVTYYVIFDPERHLSREAVRVYRWEEYKYRRQRNSQFPVAKLGLQLWDGEFEGVHTTWLRWVDEDGRRILTGNERAAKEHAEKQTALKEKTMAVKEKDAAVKEKDAALTEKEAALQRAEKMAELLRQLGKDPDAI